jgi:putative flippase GtrA
VDLSPAALMDRARSPDGQKAIKYTLVSVISVAVYQAALALFYGLLRWKATPANITANVCGGIPSYYLNRTWAWGKSGRSHFWKEIVPFWALAFIGMAFSTWAAVLGDHFAQDHVTSHLAKTVIVLGAAFGSFFVLWVVKFVLFNKFIFKNPQDEPKAAWADEIVA